VAKPKLVLASSSERRIGVLGMFCRDLVVLEPSYEEVLLSDPVETVRANAVGKALSVLDRAPERSIVIGLDTAVHVPGYGVLGKPADGSDARRVLQLLSGRAHVVYTGVYAVSKPERRGAFTYVSTRVKFRELSPEAIEWYLDTGEWVGKAGGYAAQGYASVFIEWIEGDFFNVVGMPVAALHELLLDNFGFNLLECQRPSVSAQ